LEEAEEVIRRLQDIGYKRMITTPHIMSHAYPNDTKVIELKLSELKDAEPSEKVRERVIKARQIQEERFKDIDGVYCNAQMSSKQMRTFAQIDKAGSELLKNAMQRLNLSARAYDRIIKVARTIADLDTAENILSNHIAEAINYRNLDREGWAG